MEIKQIIEEIVEYMDNLIGVIEEVSAHDMGNVDFLNAIPIIIDSFQEVLKALQNTQEIHQIELNESKMKEFILEGIVALENQDENLLKDILEYDMKEILLEWYHVLKCTIVDMN